MNYFRCRSILLLFLLLSNCITCIIASQENFTEGLKALLSDGSVTEEQVKRWWYHTEAQRRGFPRTFPICFDTKQPLPGKVEKFREIIEKLNDLKAYDPNISGWPSSVYIQSASHQNIFNKMEHNRITIQASTPNKDILGDRPGGVEGEKPLLLLQLVDFLVSFREPIKGLYVQAYGGPMGVPTGEFLTDLKCTEGKADDPDYPHNINVIPCHYAPRTAFNHPNVFIFDTETRASVRKVQFRWRWTETQCHETAFFQFIMLATHDFTTFTSILSPVFHYSLEKASAVPTPYHPYHDKVTCLGGHGLVRDPDDRTRIMPNKQYDECILQGTGRDQLLEDHTCPPGQFKCDMDWSGVYSWKYEMDLWEQEFVVPTSSKKCCKLELSKGTGESTKTPEATVQEKQENYLKEVILRSEKRQQITHGDFCLLVWMVLVPLANLISRFFKDFAEIPSLGLGFWIVGHFTLHTSGIIMVWWSFGLVVGGGQDRLGNVSGRHFLLGIIATAIQHAQFVTGLRRQEENERRIFNYVLIHSVGGYFSHFVAYIAVLLSNADPERKYFSFGLFVIWLIATISFHVVETRQDKLLGVVLHRAQCPVLQRIVVDGGRPPMFKTKITILAVTFLACISLYIFMKIYFSLVQDIITEQIITEKKNTTDARFVVLN